MKTGLLSGLMIVGTIVASLNATAETVDGEKLQSRYRDIQKSYRNGMLVADKDQCGFVGCCRAHTCYRERNNATGNCDACSDK